MSTPHLAARLQGFGTTVFAEMSALALATGSVNLGQGFPDSDGPAFMLEAARQAITDGVNQYPPGRGIAPLREAIAAHSLRCIRTPSRGCARGSGPAGCGPRRR